MASESRTQRVSSGASLGALVGFVTGMSASPVVQGLLGALGGLLVAWLSLRPASAQAHGAERAPAEPPSTLRLVSFALAALAALLLGLHARVHDWLGASLEERIERWERAGWSHPDAMAIVLQQELGDGARRAAQRSGVLFGTEGSLPNLDPASFRNDPERVLASYRLSGPPWDALVEPLEGLQPERQLVILEAVWQLLRETR